MYLENINGPEDVKKLSLEEMETLAEEMRGALLKRASIHGGHFGPNFGMVEATIALHYVFESPKDKIVFDVSHQTYPHKMLTGRKDAYLYEDKYDEVSGYSNPEESDHDHFIIGHTSTSISLACGLAKGRDLQGNLIIVVNDNDMSIAENHGGMYENLKLLRETKGQAECNLFKAMGLSYVYVDQGNDVTALIEAFSQVKDSKTPVVVHIRTLKGKGYAPAEKNKEQWHYSGPFHIETGEPLGTGNEGESYEEITAQYLMDKMKKDPKVLGITSATPTVMGFTADRRKEAGSQFIDVGIAEETAMALASGAAKAGAKPVYGVYSTFVQRTFDQLSQDVCINNSSVAIITFWGGVYGMNDVTHLGLYDIPMMANIPNLVYLAPVTKEDYLAMLDWSIEQDEHPVAIRVPGGKFKSDGKKVTKDFSKLNQYEVTKKGSKVAVIGLGAFYGLGEETAKVIREKTGVEPTVINPYYITGLDEALLEDLKKEHQVVITLEDGILDGGFGEKIARYYGDSDMKVLNFGLKKEFLDRYDVQDVLKKNHLTASQIAEDVLKLL